MSDPHSKNDYPRHNLMKPKSYKPNYAGSGALGDRVLGPINSTTDKIPAKGKEGAVLNANCHANTHVRMGQAVPKSDKDFAPGFTSPKPMKMGKTHGFRAHEGQHGVDKPDRDTSLRFSGHKSAHRIGEYCEGFGRSDYHTQGNTQKEHDMKPMKAHGPANVKPMGKSTSKIQRGNIKQPKKGSGDKKFPGHREAGKE